jgi:DNA-binding transcriptional MerR regulator
MVISEVSEKYGLSQETLRYYERIGLIPPVPRKPNGIRDYDDYSCGWIEFIHCMRNAGIQVEVLVEYVLLFQQGSKTKEARKALLQEELNRLNERLANLQATRDRLACKVEKYDDLEKSRSKECEAR